MLAKKATKQREREVVDKVDNAQPDSLSNFSLSQTQQQLSELPWTNGGIYIYYIQFYGVPFLLVLQLVLQLLGNENDQI